MSKIDKAAKDAAQQAVEELTDPRWLPTARFWNPHATRQDVLVDMLAKRGWQVEASILSLCKKVPEEFDKQLNKLLSISAQDARRLFLNIMDELSATHRTPIVRHVGSIE